MKTKLTLGSLFDGSGGFPLGGLLAGITPVWASEIEPFPIRVTTKRLDSYSIQGSMIGRAEKNGPQGDGINENVSFTLNTVDRHAVCFSQEAYGKYSENDKCAALRASGGDYGGGSEVLLYCSGKESHFTQVTAELAGTLVATDYKSPPIVNQGYIVRRLTPTECAKLQGFPPWWCTGLETTEPTEADVDFWSEVWETHRKIVGSSTKPKTRNQVIKWLKNPHSDSAEYKMWGNGVALPNVFFVLAGIVWSTQNESE